MPVWRLQAAAAADTTLPVDSLIITPHFDDHGVGTDPENLCQDLADGLATFYTGPRQITVKAYDAEGTPPVFPAASVTIQPGLSPAAVGVREVAVCLSYYATLNRPRQRGRLFVPVPIMVTGSTGSGRPSLAIRTKVAELVPLLAGLGGLDVDWVVWSRSDQTARKVTNWWVDDAWDIQRSRGLRPSARLEGSTGG